MPPRSLPDNEGIPLRSLILNHKNRSVTEARYSSTAQLRCGRLERASRAFKAKVIALSPGRYSAAGPSPFSRR